MRPNRLLHAAMAASLLAFAPGGAGANIFFDINLTVVAPGLTPDFGTGTVSPGEELFDANNPTGILEILLDEIPVGGPTAPFPVNHTMTINGVSLSFSNFELVPGNTAIFTGPALTALGVTFGGSSSSIGYHTGFSPTIANNFNPIQFFSFTYASAPHIDRIPEPGTLGTMLAGLAALSILRRRRRPAGDQGGGT